MDNLAADTGIILQKIDDNLSYSDPEKEKLFLKPCGGSPGTVLVNFRKLIEVPLKKQSRHVKKFCKILAIILSIIYFGFVIYTYVKSDVDIGWCYGHGKAFLLGGVTLWCSVYYLFLKPAVSNSETISKSIKNFSFKARYLRISISLTLLIIIFVFVVYDSWNYSRRLVSCCGIIFFLFISFFFSKHPDFIRWDTVLAGVTLQIIFGLLAIRWETGRNILACIGNNIVIFLNYGEVGAVFVFGDYIVNTLKVFAFQALSALYFLSMFAQILFYLGWLQIVCIKIGGCIQAVLGTTVVESINAATIVFLGMSEAPLLYSPYLASLTPSEIHAVMTSGFSTVAGTLLAAYTALGVEPRYVVTASSMAAPASLCFAKLLFPENIQSNTSSDNIQLLESEDRSVLEAASNGAASAVEMVLGIIANVIACIALIAFFNGFIGWLGELVLIQGLSLEYLVGQLFIPVAWVMGVIPGQCETVAALIGIKTMANEFVAYKQLGEFKKAGKLSQRSEAIATFALCGFSNPGALAINIAILSTLAPNKKTTINKVGLRAFVAGCITSFTSACIAGMLTADEDLLRELPQIHSN